jgi:hypothetical protein
VSDGGEDILSTEVWNPFAQWHKVLLPYGSGDTYIGTQRTPNSIGLYFAGHLQVAATIEHLLRNSTFRRARRVLFAGGSAGGIGVFQHANWLAHRLRAEGMAAVVKAAPQAGGFLVNTDLVFMGEFQQGVSLNAAPLCVEYLHAFFGGNSTFLDAECVRATPQRPHTCWSAAVHYPFIEVPMYVAQNRFDQSQAGSVFGADWWPLPLSRTKHAIARRDFLRYFGNQTASGLIRSVQTSPKAALDGLFVPSCYAHTNNLCLRRGSRVRNVSYASSLHDWTLERGDVPHQLVDDCLGDDPCNAHCGC